MINEQKNKYRPDIDGLRAVAVLSVLIYHLNSAWLPGGFIGVDVFFVISGFVVASSLAASNSDSFLGFLSEFYARRLARILPALVIMLIISTLLATLFIPKAWLSELSDDTARYAYGGLSNILMQNNLDAYFAPRAEFNPYTHTWSLGVEEQYYLVAPLILFIWIKGYSVFKIKNKAIFVYIFGILIISSLIFCISLTGSKSSVAFYSSLSRFWELASGAFLFVLTKDKKNFCQGGWKYALHIMGAWVGLFIIFTAFVFADPKSFPWPWAVLPVMGTLLLIGGYHIAPVDGVRRFLAAPGTVWIGKRSYSIYLWHWPVFVLMRWTVGLESLIQYVAAIFISFILALLSYKYIEVPMRHNAWFEKKTKWRRILLMVLMPIFGLIFTNHLFANRDTYSLSRVIRKSNDWYATQKMEFPEAGNRKCSVVVEGKPLAGGHVTRFFPSYCNDNVKNNKKIFAMGDSHTGMISALFDQLSAEEGFEINLFTGPGCNFIDFRSPVNAVDRTVECQVFTKAMIENALSISNPGDIVILSSLRLQRYGDQWANFGIIDMYDLMYGAHAAPARLAAYEDAKQWLQSFTDKGLQVVFTAPTPVFKAPPFRCSDWFNSSNSICVGENQQSRSELEKLREPIITSMNALTAVYPNVKVWDAFFVLCPNEICRTEMNDRPIFFDGDHLSAYGNLVIYPSFKAMVMGVAAPQEKSKI